MDDITLAVVEAVPEVPVTVKMRAGWDQSSIVAPEAGERLEKIGVKACLVSSLDEAHTVIANRLTAGDIVITLGAGNVNHICTTLGELLHG